MRIRYQVSHPVRLGLCRYQFIAVAHKTCLRRLPLPASLPRFRWSRVFRLSASDPSLCLLTMASASRLKGLGAVLAASGASWAAVALVQPPTASASERGPTGIESARQKIADPFAVVPTREVQESALIGTSPINPLDVLVIGGGATGCGVALDAATRGLRVGLVEREDFSSGSSSRSTKLVHGG